MELQMMKVRFTTTHAGFETNLDACTSCITKPTPCTWNWWGHCSRETKNMSRVTYNLYFD